MLFMMMAYTCPASGSARPCVTAMEDQVAVEAPTEGESGGGSMFR
jgi:hypothetical protein